MEMLIQQGIVEIVCDCIKLDDSRYVAVALEAITHLLYFGKVYYTIDGKNEMVGRIEQLGMFEVLEKLQYHPVEIVYEKTLNILEAYFDTENEN
jgi:hypothetical protein